MVTRTIKIFHKFPNKLIVPDLKTTDDIDNEIIRKNRRSSLGRSLT